MSDLMAINAAKFTNIFANLKSSISILISILMKLLAKYYLGDV